MTTKAKRIISIVIVSIILISTAVLIISCNAVKEYEYKYLEDAYEAGWITEDDLKTIADYWNNKTRPEMQLSQEVMDGIKYTHFKKNNEHFDALESKYLFLKNKRNISIKYYGTYKGYIVAGVSGGMNSTYLPVIHDEKTIGGVTFYRLIEPRVYKIN